MFFSSFSHVSLSPSVGTLSFFSHVETDRPPHTQSLFLSSCVSTEWLSLFFFRLTPFYYSINGPCVFAPVAPCLGLEYDLFSSRREDLHPLEFSGFPRAGSRSYPSSISGYCGLASLNVCGRVTNEDFFFWWGWSIPIGQPGVDVLGCFSFVDWLAILSTSIAAFYTDHLGSFFSVHTPFHSTLPSSCLRALVLDSIVVLSCRHLDFHFFTHGFSRPSLPDNEGSRDRFRRSSAKNFLRLGFLCPLHLSASGSPVLHFLTPPPQQTFPSPFCRACGMIGQGWC